jgi:hypothetical protein
MVVVLRHLSTLKTLGVVFAPLLSKGGDFWYKPAAEIPPSPLFQRGDFLQYLSLYEILDFKGRKKYSESIFLRCLFNAAREVMHDGPEL